MFFDIVPAPVLEKEFVGKEDEKIKWKKDDNKAYTVQVGVRRKWRRKE